MRLTPHTGRRGLRRGSIHRLLLGTAASVVLIVVLLWLMVPRRPEPIFVYCAVGSRGPMEKIAAAFEEEFGQRVQLQFAGSGTLLTGIDLSRAGDVLVCSDDQYIALGREKQLISESFTVARQHPVLAVAKGNPHGIQTLGQLLDSDMRISLPNPELDGIGSVVRNCLTKTGDWSAIEQRVAVFAPTVNHVAERIKLGKADAGFVWHQTVQLHADALDLVALPQLDGVVSQVSVAVLTSSEQPQAAAKFANYVASEAGGKVFAEFGFEPAGAGQDAR